MSWLEKERKSIPLNRYPYFRRSWKEIRNASTFSFQKLIVLFLDLKLYFSVAFALRTTTIPLIWHLPQEVQLDPISGGSDKKNDPIAIWDWWVWEGKGRGSKGLQMGR